MNVMGSCPCQNPAWTPAPTLSPFCLQIWPPRTTINTHSHYHAPVLIISDHSWNSSHTILLKNSACMHALTLTDSHSLTHSLSEAIQFCLSACLCQALLYFLCMCPSFFTLPLLSVSWFLPLPSLSCLLIAWTLPVTLTLTLPAVLDLFALISLFAWLHDTWQC